MHKIAVMIHGLRGGGAEKAASELMARLAERCAVTAILLEPETPQDYPLPPEVRKACFPAVFTEKAQTMLSAEALRACEIRRFKRQERFDACVSFLEQANYLNVLSAGPELTCVSIRNLASAKTALKGMAPEYLRLKGLDRCADRVVCVSGDVARDQEEHYGIPARRLRVLYNWVDPEAIGRRAEEPLEDAAFDAFAARHPFLLAHSGRMDIQKGHWHLLRAFDAFRARHPEAGLFLLGGELEATGIAARLADEIRARHMEDCVWLCGVRANPFPYLKRADGFVFSSLYEGFSNALLEALAMGLPVIAAECAGVRELLAPSRAPSEPVTGVVTGEAGILTPALDAEWPQDPALTDAEQVLCDAMVRLAEQPELRERLRREGVRRAADFSPDGILSQWEDLLQEAPAGRCRRRWGHFRARMQVRRWIREERH